jgi:hypothetical protein
VTCPTVGSTSALVALGVLTATGDGIDGYGRTQPNVLGASVCVLANRLLKESK